MYIYIYIYTHIHTCIHVPYMLRGWHREARRARIILHVGVRVIWLTCTLHTCCILMMVMPLPRGMMTIIMYRDIRVQLF